MDFIIVSEGISETMDNKVKKDGNTWLGEVGYKKGNLLYSLSSMIGIGKKKSWMDLKSMKYEHSSHLNKILIVIPNLWKDSHCLQRMLNCGMAPQLPLGYGNHRNM